MQHGNAILDDGRFADHHAGAVVDEDAFADHRAGMDVEPEQRARAALQVVGQRLAALHPEPVGHPIGLQGMVALEPEQRIEMGSAGGVTLGDSHDVGPRGEPDALIGGQRLIEGLADQRRRHLGRASEPGQMIAQRVLEPGLAQDRGVEGASQNRLGGRSREGRLANPAPDRIDRPQLGRIAGRILGNCAVHGALLRFATVSMTCEAIDAPP